MAIPRPSILSELGQQTFASGAVRDSQHNKKRFDLIPIPALCRIADRFTLGATLYGEDNYQKGIPFRRMYASLLRHIYQWAAGEKSEDHLAAVCTNAIILMYYEQQIKDGILSAELNNLFV